MEEKIKVGILGATGMVGQKYVSLLEDHPWFKVSYVAASGKSSGKTYGEAVEGRWHMDKEIPLGVRDLNVYNAAEMINEDLRKCKFVFSALDLENKDELKKLEEDYAKIGIPVVSNASAHRWTIDVPMLIPEINSEHLDIIPYQRKNHGFDKGFIVVKPNCSLQSYLTPVHALMRAGYDVENMVITTMQALSGAGYPGVASLDIIDNIIPYIKGEEEKSEKEPLKILGRVENGEILNYDRLKISAHCTRVPVRDGHIASVELRLGNKKPDLEEVIEIWEGFRSVPQELGLPSAPLRPIVYLRDEKRPQPRKDRDLGEGRAKGMVVSVGRLRKCEVFDISFFGLSHNIIRGAAGGGILNAELLKAKGYFDKV